MNNLNSTGRARCLLVWLAVTAAAVAAVAWAAPDLAAGLEAAQAQRLATQPFDRLVVWVAAVAVAGCATWFWVVTGIVVAQALSGRPPTAASGVPGWLRTAVLAACGLALVGGSAAHAQEPHSDGTRPDPGVLAGLPPPERVLGGMRPPTPPVPEEPARVHVVRTGDTLWDLAAAELGDPSRWPLIYRANKPVIGADPDLIRPGQQLRMPSPPTE